MTDFAERARREKRETAALLGIDEALVSALVEDFYGRVRQDPLIGPVFAARIRDWGPHLAQMKDFWVSIAIDSGRYHGTPMQKHAAIPELDHQHFERWLELWRHTTTALCPSMAAREFFHHRADRIAESLQLGIQRSRAAQTFPSQQGVSQP